MFHRWQLKNGERIEVSIEGNMFDMDKEDREFVCGLMATIAVYERGLKGRSDM